MPGKNDLRTKFPKIAAEWHPNKNENIAPNMVVAGSNKKVWWLCNNCGYEWQTSIYIRTTGHGCPKCARKAIGIKASLNAARQHNLLETFPKIAAQWHPALNSSLTPQIISYGSKQKVWWLCDKCGHEWQAQINNRTHSKVAGCPKCKQSPYDITNNTQEKT